MPAKARRSLRLAVLVAAVAGWAAAAQPAFAHIQIRPTSAAPGDSVLFELLVPGERDARTVEVALQIPEGVLPFSFEDTPGWRREVELADDGSTEVVRWRGRLATDGFMRFAMLAATPEREGEIEWKAIQTYDDGQEARWIGPPDSDNPSAVTTITASATRENAGGEGADASPAGDAEATADDAAAVAPTDQQPARTEESSDDSGNTLALVLGAAGVVLGAAALIVALRRRRPQQPALRQDPG